MDVIYDWIYRAFVLGQLRLYWHLPAVLFLAVPIIIWIYAGFQSKRRWRIRYPVTSTLAQIPRVKKLKRFSRHLAVILRVLVLILVILSAMRPQMGKTQERVNTQGVDIMLTLDISPSMNAEDFDPNRAEAAKEVLIDFVGRNTSDRIGLVVFSGRAFTQCPMTTDTMILEEFISQVTIGDVTEYGTAIGDAILTGVARFPDEDVVSKVMILLTDGESNMGQYDPLTAARIAAREGVRIYTIGVGDPAGVPIPNPNRPGEFLRDWSGRLVYTTLDEAVLTDIARVTGGRYYRAEDETALARIYDEIGQLETHEIESHRYTTFTDLFQWLLGAALILLLLELISRGIWGRVLP